MLVSDRVVLAGEVFDGCLGVDGVPADDGVGKQGETFALKILVIGAATANLALVGLSDPLCKWCGLR